MSSDEKRPCVLHPVKPKENDQNNDKDKDKKPPPPPLKCEDCAPWQRYMLYLLPALFFIPWAIGKVRCKPKCCPPVACCPPQQPPVPQPHTYCPHQPAKALRNPCPPQPQDECCGKNKRSCNKKVKAPPQREKCNKKSKKPPKDEECD